MTNRKRIAIMRELQDECLMTFTAKQVDYGGAFEVCGPVGVIVRIKDKIDRYISVSKNSITMVSDEKLENTLLDLANYAMMCVMLLREGREDEKEPD